MIRFIEEELEEMKKTGEWRGEGNDEGESATRGRIV